MYNLARLWCAFDIGGVCDLKKLLCIRGRRSCGVPLPPIVLMSIGNVANAPYDETREIIHQAGSFRLETETVFRYQIPFSCILDDLVARSDSTVVDIRILIGSFLASHLFRAVALATVSLTV